MGGRCSFGLFMRISNRRPMRRAAKPGSSICRQQPFAKTLHRWLAPRTIVGEAEGTLGPATSGRGSWEGMFHGTNGAAGADA